jgi:hypothetical protein
MTATHNLNLRRTLSGRHVRTAPHHLQTNGEFSSGAKAIEEAM